MYELRRENFEQKEVRIKETTAGVPFYTKKCKSRRARTVTMVITPFFPQLPDYQGIVSAQCESSYIAQSPGEGKP